MINLNSYINPLIRVILLGIFLMSPKDISSDCGPDYITYEGYTFLIPSIIDPEAPATFLPGFTSLYETYGKQEVVQPEDNIQEWWERHEKIPDYDDIYSLVYKTNIELLRQLQWAAQEKSRALGATLRRNSFITLNVPCK